MNKHRVVLVVVSLVMSGVVLDSSAAEPRETAAERVNSGRLLIIAHRGHSSVAPENTLPAFRAAIEARADLIELDYYHSADGTPVVFHDKTLERTSDAKKVLGNPALTTSDVTLANLRRLDVGLWFDLQFAGTRIPTLAESLDLIQSGSMTLIERKGGDAATCVELLKQRGLSDAVVVQAFDWAYLRDCHRLDPGLVLGALGSDELTAERLKEIENTGAQVIGWNHKFIGPEEIEMIHAAGRKAWVYTVNDAARARELVAAGIDGIITDRAAEIRKALLETK